MENINLSITSMLIDWGLITDQITTEKFGWFKPCFVFCLNLYLLIKWITLMFFPIENEMTDYLGEMPYWIGPKLIVDFLIVYSSLNSMILVIFLNFHLKFSHKMSFWLKLM